MDIKPIDKSIKELLGSKKQFCIPRFQREYSWDKKNYQEFFDDMINCIKIENGKIKTTQYFLGTMLFIGDYDDKNENKIQVVDGQQRLTTITILFSALSDRFISINEIKLSDKIFEYIMNEDDNGNQVRVLKSNTSYPYFSYFIQDKKKSNSKNLPISEEEQCINKSYDYLYNCLDEKKIREKLSKKHGSDNVKSIKYVDILKAIRDQVLQTIFISISTHDKERANSIFEILNAKGKSLTYVDLIKNQIFDVLNDSEPADYAEEQWKKIKIILAGKENDESVGFATFYRHFWSSRYKKSTATKMFDDFRELFKIRNKDKYIEFLQNMENDSKIYMKIVNPSRNDYKSRKEYFWLVQSLNVLSNYFNITQVRVVILALFDLKNHSLIDNKEFKKTIIYLENFHFIYNSIMGNTPNRVENIYSNFAINVRKLETKQSVKQFIEQELIEKMNKFIPKFSEFLIKFCDLEYSKNSIQSNVKTKYVIYKLNAYFERKELFDDNGSIEHIIPENANTTNIGNLILLENDLNNYVDSKEFTDKRQYYDNSNYKWVRKFNETYSTFEIKDFSDRAENLAKIYYQKILNYKIDKETINSEKKELVEV